MERNATRQIGEEERMKKVLVLCTGNSARSQMGESLFRHEGGGEYEVQSAGTSPSHVRPEAIAVMKEIGIDIAGHRSKSVDEFSGQSMDYVVTVCDNARDTARCFRPAPRGFTGASKILRQFRAASRNVWPHFAAFAIRSMNV
jgi:protein-tyrosine-phosphatase